MTKIIIINTYPENSVQAGKICLPGRDGRVPSDAITHIGTKEELLANATNDLFHYSGCNASDKYKRTVAHYIREHLS